MATAKSCWQFPRTAAVQILDFSPLRKGLDLRRVGRPPRTSDDLIQGLNLWLQQNQLVISQGKPNANAHVKQLDQLSCMLQNTGPRSRIAGLEMSAIGLVVALRWPIKAIRRKGFSLILKVCLVSPVGVKDNLIIRKQKRSKKITAGVACRGSSTAAW